MKRIIIGALAAAAFAMPLGAQNTWEANVQPTPPRGGAAGNIVGTLHNLNTRRGSATRPGGDIQNYRGEICIFCHSPHKTTSTNLPLWNRQLSTSTFTMYYPDGARAGQLQPGPTSLSCLGCHEGTIALDNIANKGAFPAPPSLGGLIMSFANIGTNLSDDHPIGIDYPEGVASFNPVADVGTAGLRLYTRAGGDALKRVECASCHDPHRNSPTGRFERISNDGSALCLACHVK